MSQYAENLKLLKQTSKILYDQLNEQPLYYVKMQKMLEFDEFEIEFNSKKVSMHSVYDVNFEMEKTFQKVTEARTSAMNAGSVAEKAGAENMLTGALKSLFAVSESYPDLKANQNFLELQKELSDTENKIQAARRFYNGNVRDLNTKIESVPSNIIANCMDIVFHSMIALTQFLDIFCRARYMIFNNAVSFGNTPLVFVTLRICLCTPSRVLVVYIIFLMAGSY